MNPLDKLVLYFRSAIALRSFNLWGLPILPKRFFPALPASRNAYNTFVIWIRRLGLQTASTILDVGANHGDFAQAASACFPTAKVFLFEPLPDLQQKLSGMIEARQTNWRLMPFALGSQRGKFPLYLDQGDDAIGSLAGFTEDYLKANPRTRPSREIICDVRKLDDVISEQGIATIDLLKIDVEGFEFEVLKGGTSALSITQAVIVEVSLVRRSPGAGHPLVEMIDLLTRSGFHVVEVFPSLFEPDSVWKPVEFNLLLRR